MDRATREFVRRRAGDRCEYCRVPQAATLPVTHHVEHVRAVQHDGTDDVDNLALACASCNLHKGPNLSGVDPETGKIVRLFDPRSQRWTRHFRWDGIELRGVTRAGRATAKLLAMNNADRLAIREVWGTG